MREKNAAGSSRGRQGIKILYVVGMFVAGAGLVTVAGGFPPQPWVFLVHMLPQLPLLWKTQGIAILPALGALLLVALSLLLAWILLLYFFVQVVKSMFASSKLEEWNGGNWQKKDHDEETHPIMGLRPLQVDERTLEGEYSRRMGEKRLVKREEEQVSSVKTNRMTDAFADMGGNGRQIVGARERYYARFSEPETQPLGVLVMAYERSEGLSKEQQKYVDRSTLPDRQQWWQQEEGGTDADRSGKESSEQWWTQTMQDELPTTEPGQDEESDVPFITEPIEDEVMPGHLARFFLEREGGDVVGAGKKGMRSEGDAGPMAFFFGVGLDVGITHKGSPNEDSVLATTGIRMTSRDPEPVGLFMVADGLGGHEQGCEASHLAVSTASDAILPVVLHETAGSGDEEEDGWTALMQDGVRRANVALYQRNCEQSTSMGTTFTAALLVGKRAFIVNVGDSRTYLYRPGEGLRQLTRDHSLVMRLVEVGAMAREDLYVHPLRNQVYRSLGNAAEVEVETTMMDVQAGDFLLLCSDGLWEMVRDSEIEAIMGQGTGAAQLSGRLVQAALRNGGADNIGVVVVSVVKADA